MLQLAKASAYFAIWIFALALSLQAQAAGLESLLSPGPLTEAHAEFEGSCDQCHENFDQAGQTQRCIACHEEIAEDLATKTSFHGKHPTIHERACRSCHTEHEGRDKDITGMVRETFDHDLTEFPLVGPHALPECGSCHKDDGAFRDTPAACVDCHLEEDAHQGSLGEDCGNCHEVQAQAQWSGTLFDHEKDTDFSLVGSHAEQACNSCHIDNQFEDTADTCVDCHKLDDVHKGSRGEDCAQCHKPTDWQSSDFDHTANTDFKLLGVHTELTCSRCHLDNMALEEPPLTCVGCHSADDVHVGSRGSQCGDCHNNDSWNLEFDHYSETKFALQGAHDLISCESCHVTNLTDSLPTSCEKCHEEDDPHASTLGACDSCHNETVWVDKVAFDHEFTKFPLVGLHQLTTCDECHTSLIFEEVGDACIDCHRNDDKHENSFGEECSECHNPGAWELWDFDHDNQTAFALLGSHQDLICASCHNKGSGMAETLSTECVNCHFQDDRHNGQFGRDCERCHTTDTFKEGVRFR